MIRKKNICMAYNLNEIKIKQLSERERKREKLNSIMDYNFTIK
jgi:hypothetical protein